MSPVQPIRSLEDEEVRRLSRPVHAALKRSIDVAGALGALLLLSPMLLAAAVAGRLTMGRPVLFRQERVGRDAERFTLWKLRTMTDERGPDGALRPDAERLTRLGALLRATSVDELPELVQVLRGQLSLVGPRPLLVQYLPLYTPEQARRHDVRPGITGWAQVNGRNATSWPDRLALDTWYVDHMSLFLDLRILCRTVAQVFRRADITFEGHATMPVFQGAEEEAASTVPPP
ncbi:MAG: sugar transferase [Mycobacteriales bacterium]